MMTTLTRIAFGAVLAVLAACGNAKPIIDKFGDAGPDAEATNDATTGDAADGGVDAGPDAAPSDAPKADATATDANASDGAPPVCPAPVTDTNGLLVNGSGIAVEASVKADVTVSAVSRCFDLKCPNDFGVQATHLGLAAADGKTWKLFVQLPDLPTDLIRVGDAFTLDVTASVKQTIVFRVVNQSVVLARDGKLALFVAKTGGASVPVLPDVSAYGLGLQDAGVVCEGATAPNCLRRGHAVRATFAGASTVVSPGQTTTVGTLSFTSTKFDELALCDAPSIASLGGFVPR
jgi:hypothetical protein